MARRSWSSLAQRPGIILAILAGMAVPSSAGFTIQSLGVITPNGTSAGSSINAGGSVAGSATNANGTTVAVQTVGSSFQQISSNALGVSSVANSINFYGRVAGTYVDSNGINHGFTSSGGGVVTISNFAGGTYTQANGINLSGEVVGTGDIANGTTRAFTVGAGGLPTAINPLGTGTFSLGNGINDSGTVVGSSQITPGGQVHAFITNPTGTAVDLLSRNSAGNFNFNTYGTAIANNGDAAGYGDVGRFEHAFYAPGTGGSLIDLGVLPGGSSSESLALNDNGLVVGESSFGSVTPGQPNSLAFIWSSLEGMVNLNSLISVGDQTNWVLISATGINDNNQITGFGLFNGVEVGYLLTPIPGEPLFSTPETIPEPNSALLATIGLAAVVGWSCLRRGRTGGRATA